MSSPELDPCVLAEYMEPARALRRQGKTAEEIQRELIRQGATVDEAAQITDLACFTETISQVDPSRGGRPHWMGAGEEWLDGIAWLCILACGTLIVSWIVRAVQGNPPSL